MQSIDSHHKQNNIPPSAIDDTRMEKVWDPLLDGDERLTLLLFQKF